MSDLLQITLGEHIDVPAEIGQCLACHDRLIVDAFEFELESGRITPAGYHVWCRSDNVMGQGGCSQELCYHLGKLLLHERIFVWLTEHVRVSLPQDEPVSLTVHQADEIANAPEVEEAFSQAWLCVCGHYQEDGLHCTVCGAEPPWGCDCGAHESYDDEYGDEYDGPPLPLEAYQEPEASWYALSAEALRDDWEEMPDDWQAEEES